ncbi:VanZ like protein (fragment) [Xanthomonas phaseoli pv. phaseoli]
MCFLGTRGGIRHWLPVVCIGAALTLGIRPCVSGLLPIPEDGGSGTYYAISHAVGLLSG